MKNAQIIGAVCILLMAVTSCARYDQEVSIENVSEVQTIVLKKIPGKGPPQSINIRVRGSIDGQAKIFLMLDGKPYKTQHLNNNINFTWGGDWYDDTAEIRYEPTKETKGKLLIEYKFNTVN